MSLSIIHDNVFIARGMAPERPLITIDDPGKRFDGHCAAIAAGKTGNRNAASDLDDGRLGDERSVIESCGHTRLLLNGTSRVAEHELSSIDVKSLLTKYFSLIEQAWLTLTTKLFQQPSSNQPPSFNSKTLAVSLFGVRQGRFLSQSRPAFFDHEFPHHS